MIGWQSVAAALDLATEASLRVPLYVELGRIHAGTLALLPIISNTSSYDLSGCLISTRMTHCV
jgi:hypothetical protein